MPSSASLVASIDVLALQRTSVPLLWHVLVLAAVGWAALTRRRWTLGFANVVLCAPLATAATLAWFMRELANAIMLTMLAGHLLALGRTLSPGRVSYARGWPRWVGAAAVLLALAYPPLVEVVDPLAQLAYAPIGVRPAPTLLLVGGAGLLLACLDSRAWAASTGAFALGYAAVGMLHGVWLDAALIPLAVTLIMTTHRTAHERAALVAERSRIDAFLQLSRIALVGASQRADDLSRVVLRSLLERQVDVTPVHPTAKVIGSQLAFPSVCAIPHHVDGAVIMTPPAQTLRVLEECARAGIHRVWLHRGIGAGASSPEVLALAARLGLEVVADRCILMFLDPLPGSVHQAHRTIERALGRYPEHDART